MKSFKKTILTILVLVGLCKDINCAVTSCYSSADSTIGSQAACTAPNDVSCLIKLDPDTKTIVSRGCAAAADCNGNICCNTDNCNEGTISSCLVSASGTGLGTKQVCSSAKAKACRVVVDASGIINGRGCVDTCTESATERCCTANNCNDAVVTSCYESADATAGTKKDCTAASKFCKLTIDANKITGRACADTCTASSTEACCSTKDCNDATSLDRTCLHTDGKSWACASSSPYCTIHFDANGALSKKSCEKLCTASETAACCVTNDCNTAISKIKSCFQCNSVAECEAAEKVFPCAFGEDSTKCKTTFTDGKASKKSCEKSCTASKTEACCDLFGCNTANLLNSCYQCEGERECNQTNASTACASAPFAGCSTAYVGIKPIWKRCEASIGCVSSENVDCCSKDSCNTLKLKPNSASTLQVLNLKSVLYLFINLGIFSKLLN